jgi:hypothetical protein
MNRCSHRPRNRWSPLVQLVFPFPSSTTIYSLTPGKWEGNVSDSLPGGMTFSEFDAPGRKGQKEEMPFKAGLFVPINRSPFRMTNASFYFLFPQGPGPGDIAALGDLTGHLDGGGFLRGPWRISDQQCAANAMLILLQWKSPTSWGGQRRRSPACKTPQPPTWRWLLRPACCRRPPSAKSPRRKTGRFWLSPSSLKGLRWRGGPAD